MDRDKYNRRYDEVAEDTLDNLVNDRVYETNVKIQAHLCKNIEDVIVQTFKWIANEHDVNLYIDEDKVLDMLTQYKLGKIYIKNFCEDLNYQKIILDISDVDREDLYGRLGKDYVNHRYRFDYIFSPNGHNLMYIENCDLQDVSTTDIFYEMIKDGYVVTKLYHDERGYYINQIKF